MHIEKIPVIISESVHEEVARIIADTIVANNAQAKNTVLGLATGKTPLELYRELIRLHKAGLDFSRVISFNLDEYMGLKPENVNSYNRYMWENLFNHINIKRENVHIPQGTVSDVESHCADYEAAIVSAGGIDVQILGIGGDGHIGFNEPGSGPESRTRMVALDEQTRSDAIADFGERANVPTHAITMGVGTIMAARRIILLATGDHKAAILKEAVEGDISDRVSASYLQRHRNVTIYCDEGAASKLIRFRTPWIVSEPDWSDSRMRLRAVLYLSERLEKKVAELTLSDFLENSLMGLVQGHDTDDLIAETLAALRSRFIPLPVGKRVLVFSPHPDDDVISMGATLRKLAQDNTVHVAYMTPGYTAVFDHAVVNFITQRTKFAERFGVPDANQALYDKILAFLAKKGHANHRMADMPEVLEIKRIIRQVEAIAACTFVGVQSYDFLELPFSLTGSAKKEAVGPSDVQIVAECIARFKPDVIFAAGDLTDPHGTHRMCLMAIERALAGMSAKPEFWLYRGAWQEYPPSEADAFVPFSLDEMLVKREAILRHESQSKDNPPVPGKGKGTFWQRAERRNKNTAKQLDLFGLDGYLAIEAFKRG